MINSAQPYKQAHEMLQNILIDKGTRKQDQLRLLESYNFDDFYDELQTWLVTGTQTWFVHGNFNKIQALDIVKNARDLLSLKEFASDQLAKVKPLELKEGESVQLQERVSDQNAQYECLLTYYQHGLIGKDLRVMLCNTLLHLFMQEQFQTYYREKHGIKKVAIREQLVRNCLGIWFLAQTDKNSSEHLCKIMNKFLVDVKLTMSQLTGDKFLALKQELNSILAIRSKDLEQENERLWSEICNM